MSEFGRETIQIFEVDQPQCSREYGDGTAPYSVDAADFDGTADYMTRGADLTSNADSKTGILSVWVRLDGGDGSEMMIYSNGALFSAAVTIKRTASNTFEIACLDTGFSFVVLLAGVNSHIAGPDWIHVLASWDVVNGKRFLYIDDVAEGTLTQFQDANIDYTAADHAIGATTNGASKFNGGIAELYLAPGQYLDLSIEANRRKFRDQAGFPVDLGSDGSTPTGAQPAIYLHLNDGSTENFSSNRGGGGDFTIAGALETASTSPSDGAPGPGCHAVLGVTGTRKCYNTRVTCQDEIAYDPVTLTLRFARPQAALLQYGNVIPSLSGVDTAPAAINLAAMDRSASALGKREVVTAAFVDHKHSDHLVDKYRLERTTGEAASDSNGDFDPYERGSFWGKWIARNPYYSAYRCRLREGYVGDALEAMRVRNYIIDRIEGPSDGAVTLVAKDLFSIIEARKSVAPLASEGRLAADISDVAASASLIPAGIGDLGYPAAGRVAIGDEVIAFTRSGDTLTLTARGALGTTAEAHDTDDLVQLVLSYETERVQAIVADLLETYSAVDPATLPLSSWDAAAGEIDALYTAHITEPTPVVDLIGELSEQAGVTFFHEVETDSVELVPLRAQSPSVTVNDRDWIIEGSLSVKRQDARRVSQVWVYYGQRDPTRDLDEKGNFHSAVVVADPEAEDLYGSPAIREVFSRWIPQFGRQAALDAGNRILAMFRDPPVEADFSIHASRAAEVGLSHFVALLTHELQDETGAEEANTVAIVELERGENEIRIKAQGVSFFEPAGTGGVRTIFIENDTLNLNLREVHDSLYAAPVGGSNGEIVRFVISEDVIVGSASTGSPAMETGDWPAGVDLTLDVAAGRVQGKGGAGGSGGYVAAINGVAGEVGGDALHVTYPLTINMADGTSVGEIWAGGGGGGGGGAGTQVIPSIAVAGGGGGAGGAGTDGGIGGSAGASIGGTPATAGGTGTSEAAGSVGEGGVHGSITGGDGGAAGGPGIAGSSGSAGSGPAGSGSGGAGAAAGKYIDGIAFVTFTTSGEGDLRGNVA